MQKIKKINAYLGKKRYDITLSYNEIILLDRLVKERKKCIDPAKNGHQINRSYIIGQLIKKENSYEFLRTELKDCQCQFNNLKDRISYLKELKDKKKVSPRAPFPKIE